MALSPSVLIGHDAELFVARNGSLIPSCGLVGGTKGQPLPIPKSKYGVKYQEDGVTLEYNQNPVPAFIRKNDAHSPGAIFIAGHKELTTWALKEKGLEVLSPCPEQEFSPDLLQHPQARTLGCDPDYCAYEPGIKRVAPDINQMGNKRFAAGHIHIGYDVKGSGVPDFIMIRLLDALVYTRWSVYDKQKGRRKFYGLAGLYRPKSYGVEWRTPSNFWLRHPSFVDDVAFLAHAVVNDPKKAREVYSGINFEEVQSTINAETDTRGYYDRAWKEIIKGI